MSQEPDRRVPPTSPLPPPQHPGGQLPRPQGWQAPPLHYPDTSHGAPQQHPPGPPAAYQPHPYRQYAQPPQAGHGAPGWPSGPPPPWGYGGYGAPPPRRRASGASRILLGLVMIVSAAVFGLALLSAVASGGGEEPFVRDAGAGDPAAPSDPNARPVDPTDFEAVMERNTLYAQGGLRQQSCVATDLDEADPEDQQRYYDRLMSCLDGEWRPLIDSAGYAYDRPTLVVFDEPISTPCGNAAPRDGRTLAFYCPGDSVLYADAPQMEKFFGDTEMAYAVVIGHEFGHHVQHEVGILLAYDDAVYAEFDNRLELSRRVELQASCMSGLFLGAVAATYPITESDFAELRQVSLSLGDERGADDNQRDHGSGISNQEWILAAFDNNDTGRCNTFTAADDQVD